MDLDKKVRVNPPGGDFDSAGLQIKVVGCGDELFVNGFASTVQDRHQLGVTWDDIPDCPFVVITDGLCSSGGLNSTNENLGLTFVRLRKYFDKQGFNIINHYNEIF